MQASTHSAESSCEANSQAKIRVHVPVEILEYGINVAALGAVAGIVGRHFAGAARCAASRMLEGRPARLGQTCVVGRW